LDVIEAARCTEVRTLEHLAELTIASTAGGCNALEVNLTSLVIAHISGFALDPRPRGSSAGTPTRPARRRFADTA